MVRHRTRNPASGLCSCAGSNPVLSLNSKTHQSSGLMGFLMLIPNRMFGWLSQLTWTCMPYQQNIKSKVQARLGKTENIPLKPHSAYKKTAADSFA